MFVIISLKDKLWFFYKHKALAKKKKRNALENLGLFKSQWL